MKKNYKVLMESVQKAGELIEIASTLSLDLSSINLDLLIKLKYELSNIWLDIGGKDKDRDDNLQKSGITIEREIVFWSEFSKLNQIFKDKGYRPEQLLRKNKEKENNRFNFFKMKQRLPLTYGQTLAKRFILYTLLCTLAMLVTQIFWISGTVLLKPHPKQQIEKYDSLYQRNLVLRNLGFKIYDKIDFESKKMHEIDALLKTTTEEKITTNLKLKKEKIYLKIIRFNSKNDSIYLLETMAHYSKNSLENEIRVQLNKLISWNFLWKSPLNFFRKIFGIKVAQVNMISNVQNNANNRPMDSIKVVKGTQATIDFRTSFYHESRDSGFILLAVQNFVLPIFYGLLGALLFILRRFRTDLGNKPIGSINNTLYFIRLFLGGLAGLAVGWFISSDGQSTPFRTENLSPLALAFLAGCGVEILFSALDNLMSKFSNENEPNPQVPPKS